MIAERGEPYLRAATEDSIASAGPTSDYKQDPAIAAGIPTMQKFYLVKMLGNMEQVTPYSPAKPLAKPTGTFTDQIDAGNDYGIMATIGQHLFPLLNKDPKTFILCRFDGQTFSYWTRTRKAQ